jgi:hypothetical protein
MPEAARVRGYEARPRGPLSLPFSGSSLETPFTREIRLCNCNRDRNQVTVSGLRTKSFRCGITRFIEPSCPALCRASRLGGHGCAIAIRMAGTSPAMTRAGNRAASPQLVGWAERSKAHALNWMSRNDGRGHGAMRLCPPYACLYENAGQNFRHHIPLVPAQAGTQRKFRRSSGFPLARE